MRVAIVEDQMMLRDSLARTIDAQKDMQVVGEASDAADAIAIARTQKADLVLMDVCTENGSSGIAAARHLKELHPDIRIVIMTGMPEITFVKQAREAGVDSFVYKNIGTDELLAVMRATAEGYTTFPHEKRFDEKVPLSDEEIAILRLVCETKTRKEIAARLFLSEGTLKRRISEILAKTGYDSILKLAVNAVSNGYIVPSVKEPDPLEK